ncbi:MAG TPA: hypothetical protein VFX61_03990 [Micromonosporaceae bacterium]|nr:hypothetical protein [Micromonosporaceae bacterium]
MTSTDDQQSGSQSSQLPEWMRNPPPPRMTLGRRWSSWLERQPRLQAARRVWWRWRAQPTLSERYPTATPIVAFFLCLAVGVFLFLGVYYLFVTM